jgi:PAS domain S-box-containing protein
MREITPRLGLLNSDGSLMRPATFGAYLVAFVSVAVAAALLLAMAPYVEGLQFVTFLPAVIITTLISGLGAGLLSVVLSVVAVALFVLPPRLSFYVDQPGEVPALVLYALAMLFNVTIIIRMRFAVEALQTSKDRLQLAFDAAQVGWWEYDPNRGLVWWDSRIKEMFDVAEDRTDIEEFKRRVHPDDIERVWAAVEAALDPTNLKPSADEFRHLRGDGEVRWTEGHTLVHFEGIGRERRAVSMVGTAKDITKRKKREERRREREEREHLLMREINHRAKNMLSVVDAIARQTAAKTPEHFIGRFSERIQALSANQDLLIRNAWHGVEVEDLVRAQLAPFADHIGTRIVVRGPQLRLNAASAQAIGLALHELTTNAGKYGALSGTGLVDVCWGTEGNTLTVNWTERNGPPVSPPRRRGFGSVVLKEMAERSVDGAVDLDYAPSGVTWRLTCPTATALEPIA